MLISGSRALLYYHQHMTTGERFVESHNLMKAMARHQLSRQDYTGRRWVTTTEEIDRFIEKRQAETDRAGEQKSRKAPMTSATVSSSFNTPIGKGVHTAHKREEEPVKKLVAPAVVDPAASRKPWSWDAWIEHGSMFSTEAGFFYTEEPVFYALPDGYWQAKEEVQYVWKEEVVR